MQYLGRIEAIQAVDVTTRTEGFIARRLFTEGKMVKQGELLYEIDPALHQASVAQAQAQLDSATASAKHAQVNLTRLQRLGNNRSVSQAEVDEAQAQRDISRAAVAQAQANLQIQQLQLSFTQIHAPISGQMGHSRFNVGSLINPASGTLVNIVQLDPIRVAIAVNERDYITATYQRAVAREKPLKIPCSFWGVLPLVFNWQMVSNIQRVVSLNRWITKLISRRERSLSVLVLPTLAICCCPVA